MVLVSDSERFGIVSASAADFAHDVDVRQKIHFDSAKAIALAGFASAAFYVEAEAAWLVAAFARFGKHGEEFADWTENAGVCGGIRTRRAANGRLVDFNYLVDELDTGDFAVCAEWFAGTVKFLRKRAVKNVVDERRFARAGNTGDDGEQADGNRDIYVLDIVGCGAKDLNGFAIGGAARRRDGDF